MPAFTPEDFRAALGQFATGVTIVTTLDEQGRRVGLTAGASAPEVLVQEVVERLRALGAVSVRTLPGAIETVHFPLPKGLGDKTMGTPLAD